MAMETRCNQGDDKHNLEPMYYKKPFMCDGCGQQGTGLRNRCKHCSFEFHEACTVIEPRTIKHEFYPGAKFEFQRTPPTAGDSEWCTRCDACRNTITGFVFHCKEKDLDLHPCCAELKKSYTIDNVKFNLRKEVERTCMWCDKKKLGKKGGWWYVSECKRYHVHVGCVTRMALEGWNRNKYEIIKRPTNRGRGTDKSWKVFKFIIEAIVSTVIGDPTTILATFVLDAITS